MKVRTALLGLVGALISWLEPTADDVVDLASRAGRRTAPADREVVGSPACGYHSEGGHFYTWQPERSEVVGWVAELAPLDHPGPDAHG